VLAAEFEGQLFAGDDKAMQAADRAVAQAVWRDLIRLGPKSDRNRGFSFSQARCTTTASLDSRPTPLVDAAMHADLGNAENLVFRNDFTHATASVKREVLAHR